MDDEPATLPALPSAAEEAPEAVISAQSALRLLLLLLTIWTFFSGLALVLFQSGAAATIGGGLGGGEGAAAQRLLGIHLLVLAAIYGLLAWEPERYRLLLWVPYATQAGIVLVTMFDLLAGNRSIQHGILPLIITATFLVLLVGVWRAGRRPAGPAPVVVEGRSAPLEPEGKDTTEETGQADQT